MSDSPSPFESRSDKPRADHLIDSLLQEKAAVARGDDEQFLQSVEAAIDLAEKETVIPLSPSQPASLHPQKPFWWTTGIAALLIIGLGFWTFGYITKFEPIYRSNIADSPGVPPTSTGTTVEPETLSAPTEVKKLEATSSNRTSPPAIATNYSHRLLQRTAKADEAAQRGVQLIADGDYQGAIDQFHAALDLLPEAPATAERRAAYVTQFSKASNLLAIDYAESGRYPEAIYLVENILAPSMDPLNLDAKRLLERLNEPDYYSPALTPAHLERVRRVKLALKTASGYIDVGDYSKAESEYNKALQDDPYNIAARRGMENNERHRMHYYEAAYDHNRAKLLKEVAAGWESPVPEAAAPPAATSSRESRAKPPAIVAAPRSVAASNSEMAAGFGVDDMGFEFKSTDSRELVQPNLPQESNTSRYGELIDNVWQSPLSSPLSTFSVDVDTASWSNLRGMISRGLTREQIPRDSVRIEELINYFKWDYPQPKSEHPFAFVTETAECPWNENHRLMRVGIRGKDIPQHERPDANLVFLLDVSGSMDQSNKLPLVKHSVSVLVEELNPNDRISIVVYSGAEGLALPTTSGANLAAVNEALEHLSAGGSTNGGAGIELAYRQAEKQFIDGGINRVILCTDGDFNVGTTSQNDLVELIEQKAESDVFLSVCAFGNDNLNDAMLEEITNRGNGNYYFIDGLKEARKVFLRDLMGTLVTIAKDVKIQVEFNPGMVKAYRLIGYANRQLKADDFENDEIDAGEVGAGHTVTALYEVVPVGAKENPATDSGLRYQKTPEPARDLEIIPSDELAWLKLRYKRPTEDTSILMSEAVFPDRQSWRHASDDFRFASAVGLFGLILREHESVEEVELAEVIKLAGDQAKNDPLGYRRAFLTHVELLGENEKPSQSQP